MERAFLAEARSPANPKYDPRVDLKAMRDMRQVVENRLKTPSEYMARGATNAIGIFKAPNQFPELADYPNDIPEYVDRAVSIANNPNYPSQAAYFQHIQNAITAATEVLSTPLASLPQATAWKRTPKTGEPESPGRNFYRLGDVGGNTFYGTLPHQAKTADPDDAKPHATDLEGKTALERLRYYARLARADAAKKPVSDDMKLHQMLIRLRQNVRSFAPPPKQRVQPQNLAPSRSSTGTAPGLPRASHSSAPQNTPPGGSEPARNAGAAMQAAATPATQNVWRSSAHLHGLRRAVRDNVMPSVAPIGLANSLNARAAVRAGRSFPQFAATQTRGGGFAPIARSHAAHAASATSGAADHPQLTPPSFSEADLRQAFEDLMYHESRLPPSGTQAFDPRLSPAWAGLKLRG